jgi:hypothetical protein
LEFFNHPQDRCLKPKLSTARFLQVAQASKEEAKGKAKGTVEKWGVFPGNMKKWWYGCYGKSHFFLVNTGQIIHLWKSMGHVHAFP